MPSGRLPTGEGLSLNPAEEDEHYRVYALGLASSVAWPAHRSSLALKLFREFEARSTFEGYSIHVSAAIAF